MTTKVIGITMVKDEEDIIEATMGHMLTQVDHVIAADNMSTDRTYEILHSFGPRVTVMSDTVVAYRQSEKMSYLAKVAREMGAQWVVPFDADEIWYSERYIISDMLLGIQKCWMTASAVLFDHVATGSDSSHPNPVVRMKWRRRNPVPLRKVACRTDPCLVIKQGNHSAVYQGKGAPDYEGLLLIRHFPYRSPEQFLRKAKNGALAYRAATEIPEDIGKHWRDYGRIAESEGDEACANIFRQWFWVENPMSGNELVYDPAPARSRR